MALVARHLTGSSGLALLAAALTALNSLLAHYSVFVHHYTFEFLVTSLILLAATWLLMDTRAERPTLRRVGWVSTLAGLGMFFSITSVLVSFPVVNLTALAALRRWSRDRRHVLAVLGWAERLQRAGTGRVRAAAGSEQRSRADRLPCRFLRSELTRLPLGASSARTGGA